MEKAKHKAVTPTGPDGCRKPSTVSHVFSLILFFLSEQF